MCDPQLLSGGYDVVDMPRDELFRVSKTLNIPS
jgi:hypothetical protein